MCSLLKFKHFSLKAFFKDGLKLVIGNIYWLKWSSMQCWDVHAWVDLTLTVYLIPEVFSSSFFRRIRSIWREASFVFSLSRECNQSCLVVTTNFVVYDKSWNAIITDVRPKSYLNSKSHLSQSENMMMMMIFSFLFASPGFRGGRITRVLRSFGYAL